MLLDMRWLLRILPIATDFHTFLLHISETVIGLISLISFYQFLAHLSVISGFSGELAGGGGGGE